MIDRVTGEVCGVEPNAILINVGGIGLRVEVTPATVEGSEVGTAKSLFTHHTLSGNQELQLRLYGFESLDARRLFLMLRSVSGIGSSTAMRLVGSQPMADLVQAIADGEAGRLKVKGVGKKTSERIVLELQKKAEQFWTRG